jgi:O-antigen ligase
MFWRKHYYLIPAIIIFYAALNTLSRAAIILAVVTATVYFFHTFVSFLSRRSKARRAWAAFWSMLAFGLVVLFSLNYAPDDIRREMDSLDTEEVLNRTTGKGVYQSSVAYEIWKDNFLFGCGGWGYKHLSVPKLLPRIRKGERLGGPGQGNVHNDYLQFLVEHGTVGFGMIVAFVVLLLVPVFKTWNWLIKGQRFKKKKDQPPAPIQIFALPASAFCILTANTAVLIHAFGDCPLRSLAVLSLFFVSLSTITGFLPERNNSRN